MLAKYGILDHAEKKYKSKNSLWTILLSVIDSSGRIHEIAHLGIFFRNIEIFEIM